MADQCREYIFLLALSMSVISIEIPSNSCCKENGGIFHTLTNMPLCKLAGKLIPPQAAFID
jgi:hypothetical protein